MKKLLFMLLISVPSFGTIYSQENNQHKAAFQFSFMPYVSTNGLHAGEYTNCISINLLTGVSKNETAFAIAGLGNIVRNNTSGVQMAGLANYVGNKGKGLLLSGLANIVSNNYNGVQLSGLANYAKNVKGLQFAGLINIAGNVDGVQFASLINIAENSDCPIGLINIIKNGEKGAAVTYDALGNTMLSFRSGGKYTYGIIGVGYNHKAKGDRFVTEAGLGVHIPCVPWFRIKNELKTLNIGIGSDHPVLNVGYALSPAFKIGKHLEIFGGASINYMTTSDMDNSNLFSKKSVWDKYTDSRVQRIYVGYQCGVQYIF